MNRIIALFLLLALAISLMGCNSKEPLNLPVKTDFSSYEQKAANTPLYTRLSPEPLTDLIPSDNYGTLYPFIGGSSAYLFRDDFIYRKKNFYGFTDATGRIIVDPIYSNVYLLAGEVGLPFWVIEKEYPDDKDGNSSYRQALVSIDGSFITDFSYGSFRAYSDCIIAEGLSFDEPVFDILDHKGELLFSTTSFSFRDPIVNCRSCENGLFLVQLKSSVSGYSYFFMDWNGVLRYGPYREAKPFCNGWASVVLMDGRHTYVDETGKPMERSFVECASYTDGYASVLTENATEILDREGKTLCTMPLYRSVPELTVTDRGIYVDSIYWVDSQRFYSFEGKLLCETVESRWLPELMIYLSVEDPKAPYLCNFLSGKRYDLPPEGEDDIISLDSFGPFCMVSYSHYPSLTQSHYIFTKDLVPLALELPSCSFFISEEVGQAKLPSLCLPAKDGLELYRPDGSSLGLSHISNFQRGRIYEGGYLSFTDSFCTKLYDPQGKLVFCFPLIGNMDD